MVKIKTLKKRRKSSKEALIRHQPDVQLMANPRVTRDALLSALAENDLETFKDVMITYLKACSLLGLSRQAGVGRRTLYDLIDGERDFNPTLRTLGAIFQTMSKV